MVRGSQWGVAALALLVAVGVQVGAAAPPNDAPIFGEGTSCESEAPADPTCTFSCEVGDTISVSMNGVGEVVGTCGGGVGFCISIASCLQEGLQSIEPSELGQCVGEGFGTFGCSAGQDR